MRLKIKNQESLDGPPKSSRSSGHRMRWIEAAAPGSLRPFQGLSASGVARAFDLTLDELREAGLQLLTGTLPYVPWLKIREANNALVVSARLNGVDAESIDLAFEGNLLKITGTQARYRERSGRKYLRIEKTLRSFERAIPLPSSFERSCAVATFSGNVLRINVPKANATPERKPADSEITAAAAPEVVPEMAAAGE